MMKKWLSGIVAGLLLSGSLIASAAEVGKSQISFSGSLTLAPVISKLAQDFIEANEIWDQVDPSFPEDNITIYVSSGGSGAGVKAVLDGVTDLGMLAREIKDSEAEKSDQMNDTKLGLDALTLSVNPDNKILEVKPDGLTKEEIVKIFSGEYKNWSDLDPALPEEEISVVTRDLGGGAHEVFQKMSWVKPKSLKTLSKRHPWEP